MKKILLISIILSTNLVAQKNTTTKENEVQTAGKVFTGLVKKVAELWSMKSRLDENSYVNCPDGFVNIHNGQNGQIGKSIGCMQIDENQRQTWHDANKYCFQKYGARLPFFSEWIIAIDNFELTNENNNFEHTNDIHRFGSGTSAATTALIVGNTSDRSTAGVDINSNGSHEFRCFIPR